MTVYILVGIVALVAGAVAARWLTMRALAALAKEAGAEEALKDALEARAKKRAEADRKRRPLAVSGLGDAWRDLWSRRGGD